MAFEFKLPDIGEGVQEGEIVQWLVKPGDVVEADQPMLEVMTDKATVVIAAPRAGTIREVRGAEGDIVQVHSVVALIDDGSGGDATPAPPASAQTRAPMAAAAVAASSAPRTAPQPPPSASGGGPALAVAAAPATRRLARELGVVLGQIEGTGPKGRVMAEDVRRAASAPAEGPKLRLASSAAEDRELPVRGLRRRIWENMARSTASAAHFTFVEECDCTELVALRSRLNTHLAEDDPKLSFLPFIVKAVVSALRRAPHLNGQVDEERMLFHQRAEVHLGVAVSSDRGLSVPVLRHPDRRSLVDIAGEIRRLADAVRDHTLGPDDLGGSTFTITSLGRDGGLFATPVINHPEVAILGVHRLRRTPVVTDDDTFEIRSVMNLSLSFDHRWVDGHVGAAFTYDVIQQLESPERLMLEMT